jgi:hypothetical protein
MIQISHINTQQEFYFIPFDYDVSNYETHIIDDITKDEITPTAVNYSVKGDKVECEIEFAITGVNKIVEDRFYTFWIGLSTDANMVAYKDKIVCATYNKATDQDWNINDGQYVEHTTPDNDYIVI